MVGSMVHVNKTTVANFKDAVKHNLKSWSMWHTVRIIERTSLRQHWTVEYMWLDL